MKRIDSANVHLDLFGPGKHGFSGGNPSTNTPATFLTPDWCNHVQEELANAVEGLGVTLNSGARNQLITALLATFANKSAFAGEVGKISYVPSTAPTENHMPAFGSLVSRSGAYSELWAFAQASGCLVTDAVHASRPGCFSYGPDGVGGMTFRVPKINGLIIKAFHNGDGSYTTDVSSLVGQYIPDQLLAHTHGVPYGTSEGDNTSNATNGGSTAGNFATTSIGGSENLVRSVVLFPQIRYRSF